MPGAGVGIRIHGDSLDAQAGGGGRYPARDFATIGDEDFGEHGGFSLLGGGANL
jgi:hypothetical protein